MREESEISRIRKMIASGIYLEQIARSDFRLDYKIQPETEEWLVTSGYTVRYRENNGKTITVIGIKPRPFRIPL